MERLLVTGVDYPLGSNLALQLADRYDVLGLYSQHGIEAEGLKTAHWASHGADAASDAAADWQPQWIIHCGPLSAASWDPPAPLESTEREAEIVKSWARVAADHAARLTVVSSDIVFSGPRMFHEESWPATNPSPRAAHARAMEQALEGSGVLVVRTHAYGWSPVREHAGFAENALNALAAGNNLVTDGRRYATPILATDLAELLARAYEKRLEGLHHLAGAERTNPFRFVSELSAAFGFHAPNGTSAIASVAAIEICEETSLNSKRARRLLEMTTPMLHDGLTRFAEQAHRGWRDRWQVLGRVSHHQIAA